MPPSRPSLRISEPPPATPRGGGRATRTPLSGIRPKPLLASDALKEDMAPLEPASAAARAACAAGSVVLAGLGVIVALGGAGPGYAPLAAYEAWAGAAVLGLLSVVQVSYLVRAYVMFMLGSAILVEALAHRGTAALLAPPGVGPWLGEAARVVAVTALPATLLFRERYRAYPRARVLLAAALLASLPYVARAVYVAVTGQETMARATAAASVAAVLSSLIGFMGAETTAMGSAWATAMVVTVSLDVAARALVPSPPTTTSGVLVTAGAFLLAAMLAAIGLFEMLAAAFARDARCIDVTRHEEPVFEDPPTDS